MMGVGVAGIGHLLLFQNKLLVFIFIFILNASRELDADGIFKATKILET